MQDVFISYSHADRDGFVKPLVSELKSRNISVWYDEFSVHPGEIIQHEIVNGIKNSLITVAIISENYLSGFWTVLEMGMKIISSEEKTLIPIIYDLDLERIAKKSPFLLGHNYIKASPDLREVADKIYLAVNHVKNQMGFHDTKRTQLGELVKRLHSYNNIKLDKLAIKINNFIRHCNTNLQSAIFVASAAADEILFDIAESEHLFFERNDEIIKVIKRSGILNENLLSHFDLIYRMRAESSPFLTDEKRQEDLYLLQISIYSISDYYALTYFRLPIIKNINICAAIPGQISEDDMAEIHSIETLVLPPHLIASTEMTEIWYEHNPFTLLGARDAATGKLVGFIHTLPVTDDLFERIKNGNFDDTTFPISDIMQYNLPGVYKLYLSSFCIHPRYHGNINVFRFIYTSFIDMLITLAEEHEIFISQIVADGATEKGMALCESIGMKKQSRSIHDTDVYYAALIPPSVSTVKLNNKHGRKLIELYNEYRDHY